MRWWRRGESGSNATNDEGGGTSGGDAPTSGASWGDEGGGSTGGGWPASGGQDPSGGEPPDDDDSGAPGTTGGAETGEDTGSSSDASTGDTTTGAEDLCDEEAPVVLYLSPDDSNSTSSPVQAREAVLGGWGLNYVPIRTWEFLNYYSFNYAAAEPGQVRVKPELARLEGAPEGEFALQIGISSPAIANADRPLMNVTLVLDESGSMSGPPDRLEKEVCRQIAGSLRAGDVVSLVGWDTTNAVKLSGHVVTKASDPVWWPSATPWPRRRHRPQRRADRRLRAGERALRRKGGSTAWC
jgi:Ca-activated chloride channel family protein